MPDMVVVSALETWTEKGYEAGEECWSWRILNVEESSRRTLFPNFLYIYCINVMPTGKKLR